MFLEITENRSGKSLSPQIQLGPNAHLDLRRYVAQWCDDNDLPRPSFSEPGSHIPNGCGDY